MSKCLECGLNEARVKFCSDRCGQLYCTRRVMRKKRFPQRMNRYLEKISYTMYQDEPETLIGDKQITHA